MRFDEEKYDRRIFGMWKVEVEDVLIQFVLHKVLNENPSLISSKEPIIHANANDEEWDDLHLRTTSTIRLSLAKNVLANVHGISTTNL